MVRAPARSLFQCSLRRKRAVKWNSLEGCFEFDWKQPAGNKGLFLHDV